MQKLKSLTFIILSVIRKAQYACNQIHVSSVVGSGSGCCSRGIQRLLVMDLTGFQYLRFWGALSNCRYKDETDFNEEKRQHEKKVKQD
jgi:hypothetical protein